MYSYVFFEGPQHRVHYVPGFLVPASDSTAMCIFCDGGPFSAVLNVQWEFNQETWVIGINMHFWAKEQLW